MIDPRDEEIIFRSLAAPGLEEDDLFMAHYGLPVPGTFWGDGWRSTAHADDGPWDEESQRRRRHAEILRRWEKPADG